MAAATDRHLLFGLIALQVGLIDQAQLVAAFQAWARDKSRSLADHLADRGGPDSEGRAAVETIVALHIKMHGGDVSQSLAAIPAGRSARASLAHIADLGLVAVYGLRTYGDGRPYYAMRFIRGDSLTDAIAAFHAGPSLEGDPGRRPLDLRKLLRRFPDVCNAIEYAHQQGTETGTRLDSTSADD